MKLKKTIMLLTCMFVIQVTMAQVKITVDVNKQSEPISRNLFGIFTEHLGANVYQGAWAQVVENPEFVPVSHWPLKDNPNSGIFLKLKGTQKMFNLHNLVSDSKKGFAAYWASSGNIKGRLLKEGSHDFQQLVAFDKGGYVQTGVFLPLHRTGRYEVKLTARSETGGGVSLQVLNLHEEILGEINFDLNTSWGTVEKKIEIDIDGHQKGDPYILRLLVKPGTVTEMSRILVFPDDHLNGWEPEVIELVRNTKLPLLRFPGGNFASGYNWRDGIGPIDQRPVLPNPAWPIMEWNHVGTDEWVKFCHLTGAEPMICINAGDGTSQEAADWVRYCNADITNPLGKLRAKNASKIPYNIKIWEVGNELCGPWQIGFTDGDGYARRYAMFAHEMLKADPGISLVANGSITVLEKSEEIHRGNNKEWNKKLMDYNGDLVRSVSVHSLVGRAAEDGSDPVEVWKDLVAFVDNYPGFLDKQVVKPMKEANVEPKIAITELMDWPSPSSVGNVTSISGALWYSGIINTCIRSNGLVELVTRSALINHGGGLRKKRGVVYAEPVHWSHYMYSSQDGTIPLGVKTESPTFSSTGKFVIKREDMPVVDAVALFDGEKESCSVFICNRDANSSHQVDISMKGMNCNKKADLVMIQCNDLTLRNSWDEPEKIAPVFEEISVKNNRIKHTLPPLSLVRIIVE